MTINTIKELNSQADAKCAMFSKFNITYEQFKPKKIYTILKNEEKPLKNQRI